MPIVSADNRSSDSSDIMMLPLPLGRVLRLSTFQIGSAMSDILTASVWNRVMITDLGMPAAPVGLLLALQYLLLPVSLWAGHRSDTRKLFGRYRASYIWLGRLLMVLAFPLLGLSIQRFEGGEAAAGWAIAVVGFLLFGVGKLMSGSVFLALVRESVPVERRGLAISLVETVLIALYPVMAIAFGRWMEHYDEAIFWQLIAVTAIVGGLGWFFAVFRVEDVERPHSHTARVPVGAMFRQLWGERATRSFFIFLGVATFAAWMQDNILEPFGGDVFQLPAGVTTRFTGYWGTATLLGLVACFYFLRKRAPEQQAGIARSGLLIMAGGLALLVVTSGLHMQALLTPALLVFGAGFGLYSFGGLSLMAVMSPGSHAGAYLGLWTICILVTKGSGTFFGGLLRDLFKLMLGLPPGTAYALVFAVAVAGLVAAALLVGRIDYAAFVRTHAER